MRKKSYRGYYDKLDVYAVDEKENWCGCPVSRYTGLYSKQSTRQLGDQISLLLEAQVRPGVGGSHCQKPFAYDSRYFFVTVCNVPMIDGWDDEK